MERRAVDLITQLSEACRGAVTLRAAAELVARVLVSQFPGSSVVVFERDAGKDTLRAVTGANIPAAWQMRAVHLLEVPLLARALQEPKRLISSAAGPDLEASCGAVPGPDQPIHLLMLLAPASPTAPEEQQLRELALEAARHLLAAVGAGVPGGAARLRTASAIHHAKVEWEAAADALPEVVGLVDRRRRVVRINRALERWSLGALGAALRRDLHEVMHPGCSGQGCRLHEQLATAWQQLGDAGTASFEVADPVLGLDLVIELRAAANHYDPAGEQPWQRAAFVISNVSAQRCAERELAKLNQTLEERVTARTEELTGANRSLLDEIARRREAERSLQTSQRELEGLSARLMSAQEEERKRIAQDLHDSIGQSLSAIKYSLERAQVLARRQELKAAADVVESAVSRVQRVMDDVRGISMNLRPAQLDDLGAASAVRWLCREWHDVYAEIAIDTEIAVEDEQIPPMLGTSVFRAVQESLNNVARHAGARRVRVAMRLDDGKLSVTVEDDGTGFALNGNVLKLVEGNGSGGLKGLRERAEQSGGRCDVSSAPGRGTTVRIEWPIAAGLAAREASAWIN